MQSLDLEPALAAAAGTFHDAHDDPADRIILASAARRRLTLVTKDRQLQAMAAGEGVTTLW